MPVRSAISAESAQALYRTVVTERPAQVIEIGMAFGVSTLAVLTALADAGAGGRLVSIDPSQSSVWQGCGAAAVERAGLAAHHTLLEEHDHLALPRLTAEGVRIGFAYIDGWHTFDRVFLDWWYLDRMLEPGGVVGFNDCGWPAVDRVIRFLLGHRAYTEVDAGLPVRLRGVRPAAEARRLLARTPRRTWYAQAQDRYFRKERDWEPGWDFYAPF